MDQEWGPSAIRAALAGGYLPVGGLGRPAGRRRTYNVAGHRLMPDRSPNETLVLLEAAQAGDAGAADRLLGRYRGRVLQIVSLRLRRRRGDLLHLEEDIVQETLLDAFQGLQSFEPHGEAGFLHWLAKLAENNIHDAGRRAAAEKRGGGCVRPMADLGESGGLSSSIFPGKEPTPSQWAEGQEREEWLESALLALPDRQRRVIELRRLCGLSFAEVAKELDLASESSARSLFSRAMAELSTHL